MATDLPVDQILSLVDDSDLERLRARAARLVDRMLTVAEHQIETATPEIKAQMIRTVLPVVLKSLEDREGGDELTDMREQQTQLMDEIRTALTGDAELEEADDAEEPPPPPARKAPAKKPAAKGPRKDPDPKPRKKPAEKRQNRRPSKLGSTPGR